MYQIPQTISEKKWVFLHDYSKKCLTFASEIKTKYLKTNLLKQNNYEYRICYW